MAKRGKARASAPERQKPSPRRSRFLDIVILGVLIILGFFSYSNFVRLGEIETDFSEYVDETDEGIGRLKTELSAGSIPGERVWDLRPSVYLVMLSDADGNNTAIATAWVVADGILATNAHVSEVFKPDSVVFLSVQSSATNVIHRVVGAEMHAGYKAFDKALDERQPWHVLPRGEVDIVVPLPGFDVGLLYVDKPEELGPPLELADQESLLSIKPGDPLAMLGFPLSGTASSHFQSLTPMPRPQFGSVTATSFYLPMVPENRSPESEYAIVHNIPSTPGNSGSPIINAEGKVVAILSSSGGDIKSLDILWEFDAEVIAQRVDLLVDLLERRDVPNMSGKHKEELDKGFAQFETSSDIIARLYVTDITQRDFEDLKYQVTKDTPRFTQLRPSYPLYSSYTAKVNSDLKKRGADEAEIKKKLAAFNFELTSPGFVVETVLDLPSVENHLIYAIDYQPYGWPCELLLLVDNPEHGWFRVGDLSQAPSMYFSSEGAATSVHLAVYRPYNIEEIFEQCGTSMDLVEIGAISWGEQAEIVTPNVLVDFLARARLAFTPAWKAIFGSE